MLFSQSRSILRAFYELFADSGFSMAGAVAFSFVLSLFPFCIFLGTLAGYFGGEALAKQAVEQLFELAPAPVAQAHRARGDGRHGPEPVRAPDLRRRDRPVLRHQRHREPARRPQRRLSRQGAAVVFPVPARERDVRGPERGRHAGAGLGRGGGAADGLALQAGLAAVACRYRVGIAASPLCHRHRRDRRAAHRLSPVARRRAAPPQRRVAGRRAVDRAVADRGAGVRVLAHDLRLLALLCGPDPDHERARVLPGERHHRHPGRRAQPRHRRGQAPAGGDRGDGKRGHPRTALADSYRQDT